MKVTAVLITKEKEYPKDIKLSKFDEVIIETECPNIYRRYELCLKAKNQIIYVQDDDCNIDIEELFKYYNGQLTNAITQHHKDFYSKMGITLVGFGTFFPKQMVDFKKYTDMWGEDKLLLSQADRVFTYLNQPFNSVVMNINNLPRATDISRMSTQPDHYINLERIKEKLCVL